jgi:hypothetical protein
MALAEYSKLSNLRLSFCKALYDGLSTASKSLVNFTDQRWIATGKTVWGEVYIIRGPSGQGNKPWIMQITVYCREDQDRYLHSAISLLDECRSVLNQNKILIYNFGTTDVSRATPVSTGVYFYPRCAEPTMIETPIDGIKGMAMRVPCYSWRDDLWN